MDYDKHISENMKRLRETMKEALKAHAKIGTYSTWTNKGGDWGIEWSSRDTQKHAEFGFDPSEYQFRWAAAELASISRRLHIEAEHLGFLIGKKQKSESLHIDEGMKKTSDEDIEFTQNYITNMIANAAKPDCLK